MNGLAQAAALISAVVYIAAHPSRCFFGRRRVLALFRVEAHNVADVRMWAFCIGFRNLLAGIGAIVGLVILWTGDEAVGRAVVAALCYMSSQVSLWPRGSARTRRPRGANGSAPSDRDLTDQLIKVVVGFGDLLRQPLVTPGKPAEGGLGCLFGVAELMTGAESCAARDDHWCG